MASVVAKLRVSVGWLLAIALLLAGSIRAVHCAEPQAAPPAAEKPVADKRVSDPSADKNQTAAKKREEDIAELNRLAEANAEAAKKAADQKRAAADKLERHRKAVKRLNLDNVGAANALAQQWRPALTSELAFIRLVCPDLPPPQRVVVRAAGEQALFSAADAAATPRPTTVPTVAGLSPQALIRVALADALHEVLPADQWERFATEAAARASRRQTAVIRLVVEHLDELLYLSQEQREQIAASLADHWQASWEGWLQLRYGRNLPNMPAELVTPYLDQDQRNAWQRIPKAQFANNAITNVNQGNVAPDNSDWWDEALPPEKDADADVPPP